MPTTIKKDTESTVWMTAFYCKSSEILELNHSLLVQTSPTEVANANCGAELGFPEVKRQNVI